MVFKNWEKSIYKIYGFLLPNEGILIPKILCYLTVNSKIPTYGRFQYYLPMALRVYIPVVLNMFRVQLHNHNVVLVFFLIFNANLLLYFNAQNAIYTFIRGSDTLKQFGK